MRTSTQIIYISLIYTTCLGVGSYMEYNKLLLHVHQVLIFLFIERIKAILQYLTNANNLEILENNGRLHIIRIM